MISVVYLKGTYKSSEQIVVLVVIHLQLKYLWMKTHFREGKWKSEFICSEQHYTFRTWSAQREDNQVRLGHSVSLHISSPILLNKLQRNKVLGTYIVECPGNSTGPT